MRFDGRIKLIEPDQLPGAGVYNPLARAIKYMRSFSPFLLIGVTPAGGLALDLNHVKLQQLLGNKMPFACSIDGDKLQVAGGIVWLCDRKLEVEEREIELDGPISVWVRITKSAAEIKYGKDFPFALDITNGRCNWPLAMVEENDDDTLEVHPRYVGDIVILTMPHIFLPGYDAAKTLVRICRSGNERYIETGECEEDDE